MLYSATSGDNSLTSNSRQRKRPCTSITFLAALMLDVCPFLRSDPLPIVQVSAHDQCMEIVAYTVAPLIHYAPFFTALAKFKNCTHWNITFPPCRTDNDVIAGAAKVDPSNKEKIVLALTSTTDSARNADFAEAAKVLGVLTPLIPRP